MSLGINNILNSVCRNVSVMQIVSMETIAIQRLAKICLSNANFTKTLWGARIGTVVFVWVTFASVVDSRTNPAVALIGLMGTLTFANMWFRTSTQINENLYLHDVCMQVLRDRGVTTLVH